MPQEGKPHLALVIIRGRFLGRKFDITSSGLTIGRSHSCDVLIGNSADGTSRQHARVSVDESGRLQVEDLGSTNGTLVNRKSASKQPLQPNDVIQIGESLLKLIVDDDELHFHEQLYRMAVCDSLTGLNNRTHFETVVEQEVSRARRGKQPLALLLLDLDNFKAINDHHGHLAGDTVLRELGELLRSLLRQHDLACRFGGDEFVLLLPATTQQAARQVADRCLRKVHSHPFSFQGQPLQVGVSIGLAVLGAQMNRSESLIAAADAALYRAKSRGRGQVIDALAGPDETNRMQSPMFRQTTPPPRGELDPATPGNFR